MSLDIPRPDYDTDSDTPNGTPKITDKLLKLQEEANKKARERREKNGWQKKKLSDLGTELPNTNTHG